MARKIVILSDGTGNAASSVWRTNVWRIFQSLKLEGQDQAARYDDGVGTSSFKPLAILGGAFGYGLKRNILESYKFICRNYEPGAKLYFLGFSRGAFTVRVLSAFILQQGLVKVEAEGELHDLARKAYRAYRANGYESISGIEKPARAIRNFFTGLLDRILKRPAYDPGKNVTGFEIEFIGVWDTVAAYGLPADEMTRGVSDWIWPLELPNRRLSERVKRARHALALDDERTTFHPVLWTEESETPPPADKAYSIDDQRLVQVWFTGMHANVGGGYPDDALAFTPLFWIMREAEKRGLVFKSEPEADPDTAKWMKAGCDPDGRLYDSRSGLGGYYRYGPRKVDDLCNDDHAGVRISVPKIHESVFARIDGGCNAYAPIGLPKTYSVVRDDGTVLPPNSAPYESDAEALARSAAQDRLWNFVWMRRIVYFLTLAATFHLIAFWLFHRWVPEREFDNPIRMVSEALRAVQSVLPGAARWWINLYASNPVAFVAGVVVLVLLLALGSKLSGKIADGMRTIWCSRGKIAPVKKGVLHDIVYWLRTRWWYLGFIRFARLKALPFLFVLALAWVTLTGASHLVFNVADSFGVYCVASPAAETKNAGNSRLEPAPKTFETSSICGATGFIVKKDFRYEIVLEVTDPWKDDTIGTTPQGFITSSRPELLTRLKFRSIILMRRVMWRPWFRAIARIGEEGIDEYFLSPVPTSALKKTNESQNAAYRGSFVARRSGEVFLYVNDVVVGLPGLSGTFYENNKGKAKVWMRVCDTSGC